MPSLVFDSGSQPPLSQVAVVTAADQDLSNLKVKVRADGVQRPAKSLHRRPQVKNLMAPPGSATEDKEVEPTHTNSYFVITAFQFFWRDATSNTTHTHFCV